MQNIKLVFWLLLFGLIALFLNEVKAILAPFIASVIIAYFLNPIAVRLEKFGIKRKWTVSIIVGIFFSILITSLLKLIPMLFEQIKQFIVAIPQYEQYVINNVLPKVSSFTAKIDPKLASDFHAQLSNFSSKFFEYTISIIHDIFDSSMAVFSIIGLIFFTPILVFYLLRDWPSVVRTIHDILPLDQKDLVLDQFCQIDRVLSAYIRGQFSVCLILSLFYVISLSILGLQYSLLVGIIAGFLAIIPYLGLVIGGSICALVALLQFSELQYVYLTLAIFLAGHLFEGYIITPKLVGEKVGLNPVWVIFSLMAGGALFGFWGVFFAIPIAAILGVIIRSLTKIYLSSQIYSK